MHRQEGIEPKVMVAEGIPATDIDELMPVRMAAEMKGVSARRIHQYIEENRLPATRIGPIFLIRRSDLDQLTHKRRGRPPKKTA
jgi:excisionase family DNA binding protein